MPVIVAHDDSCDIAQYGPIKQVGNPDTGFTVPAARLCTCGGIQLLVDLRENLLLPFESYEFSIVGQARPRVWNSSDQHQ